MFLTKPNQTISAYRSSICLKKKKKKVFGALLAPLFLSHPTSNPLRQGSPTLGFNAWWSEVELM